MTNEELNSSKTRRPYQKPQINRVKLAVEEAVLGGCKMTGYSQPGYSACYQDAFYKCSAIGS